MSEKNIELELGDFIVLDAPTNPEWHNHIFFISYIDTDMMEVIDIKSSFSFVWNWNDETLKDIKKISVIERSSLKGYAKQNGLYPHIWVDIYFGGETPKSITAEITNLEEDMIELTTYPENQVLYIDFAYQGVPRNIPIEKICIREKPASFRRGVFSEEDEVEGEGEVEGENASMEYLENGYIQIVLPKQFQPDENFHDRLQKIYALGEDDENEELEEIVQTLEIPPEQQHFGLESQVNDLLDAFLSNIPDYKRTPSVMNRIYTHIQRFKELREQFSVFDTTYHQIVGVKRPFDKPLVDKLVHLEISLPWILPVVSQVKKIYYDHDEKDGGPHLSREDEAKEPELTQMNLETEFEDETKVENDVFYKNDIPQTTVKYANMYIQTANYESTFEHYPELGLHTSPVKKDMDVLITLNNKTIGFGGIHKKRFTIQRYNSEIMYVKSRGKENASYATLFPGDSLSFQSLFLLPSAFLSFSKIKMPNTSIFQKSMLNHVYPSYFLYLQKNTRVVDNEILLDNEDVQIEINDTFQHFYLSPNDETAASMDSVDKLKALLQHSIPSFESYLLKQKNVYTFLQAVDVLEPFYVYIEDIRWQMANSIKKILYRNIDKYNTQASLKAELFKTLLLEKYKNAREEDEMNVNRLLEDKKNIEKVVELYDVGLGEFSSSEWLKYIFEYDQARLYLNYIKEKNLDLYVPEFLLPDMDIPEEDSKKCWKRVIAKKYVNFNDLKEDNNKTALFFDKELDTTDYSLVSNYKKQNADITEEEFIDYWSQTLSAKYGYTMEHALLEAEILWKGEKKITDGDYAILEQTPTLPSDLDSRTELEQEEIALESNIKKRVMYFIRKKNKWEHESDLDEYSFVDSNDLLCNIDPKCMTSKPGQCISETELLHKFKNIDREKIQKEFESRYDLSKEEFSQKYEKEAEYHDEWMEKEAKIRTEIRSFYDYKAYEYGKRAVLQELVFSPYIALRDSVLQKTLDFVTKQNYIVLFVEKFCREPILDEPMRESAHWKYCKETNTKLMPNSLYRLAKAYLEDVPFSNSVPVKYNAVLNNLCNTIGKLSDDGDAYIDKYSGYILRKIEMREEGFEIAFGETEAEADGDDTYLQMGNVVRKNDVVKIYTNEVDQRLYNMISTICRNMYIYGEENKETMMQLCIQWLKITSFFPSEATYKIGVDKIMKKRESDPKIKIPDSYPVYIKKKHVLIASLSVLVVVQTAIPEIPIDRTFPGCVKSFDGYPLKDGQDDLSSIAYLACVLKKIYHSKEDASLLPKGKGELENVLLKTVKDFILLQPSVMNMYDLKRIYLIENPMNIVIPRELEVDQKWAHFLPPIFPFSIPSKLVQAISPGGKTALDIFQVKARICSLAVVQYIREMIASKNILFQTKSGFPFLQNACCDEVLQFPPKSFLEYFFEDAAIEKMVDILRGISLKIAVLKRKYKAGTVLKERLGGESNEEEEKDAKIPRNIYHSFEPILFYATLIHYCHLDHEIYPIPLELERFCSKKPGEMSQDHYDPKSSLLEKMHFFQKHQVEMDARKMIDLMNIVNQRNRVDIVSSIVVSHKQIVAYSLESFWEINQDIPSLIETIEYKTANIDLKNNILSFIRRNASVKLSDAELAVVAKPFYFYNPDISTENLASHMKSLVYRIGILYPCFLLKNSTRKKTPNYWELLPEDVYYLSTHTQMHRELLEPFVKDPLILPIFEHSVERTRPMLDFMEYILLSNNDLETIYETSMFVLHSIFTIWIGLVDHPDIYHKVTRVLREEQEQEENRIRSDLEIDEMEEVDIAAIPMEQRDEIHQRLADLFLVMFSTLKTKKQVNAKEAIMMTYADIMREVDFSKDREKQRLKERFKKMGTDERKAENILKKLHLGDFAVDLQKINRYGKTNLLGDRDEEDDLEVAMDIAEQENEEFMVTDTRNGDSNLEDQGGEEDYADMHENAYENYLDEDYEG